MDPNLGVEDPIWNTVDPKTNVRISMLKYRVSGLSVIFVIFCKIIFNFLRENIFLKFKYRVFIESSTHFLKRFKCQKM